MKLAVISDLHLGRGDAADPFMHNDEKFNKFLKFLEKNFEKIILLGDIFETLHSPNFSYSKELLKCRAAHPKISKRFFEHKKYVYIYGNHDFVAAASPTVKETLKIKGNGSDILFLHGHQFSWMTSGRNPITESAAWLAGWGRRNNFINLTKSIENKIYYTLGVGINDFKFQKWAINVATKNNANIVVTGHTHSATCKQYENGMYINSGHCSPKNICFINIDTKNLKFGINYNY
ncbi:MAG TPA: metallophosphoesterase family protein [Candidatus Glassbacteria bacterium]|nr:metallophosphoesterase family protein [Candidatus Glassbacteria bacterium]